MASARLDGQQTTSKNLQECEEQEIAAILMTKQDSSSGGCVKHAKFVKFNSWSSWPHSGVYLLCLLQQTRVAEKLLKALPAQKAAKWCDVGSANVKKKRSVFKILKKKQLQYMIQLLILVCASVDILNLTERQDHVSNTAKWVNLNYAGFLKADRSKWKSTFQYFEAGSCLSMLGNHRFPD